MKTTLLNPAARIACTALMIFAWLTATNCCGLGLMGKKAQAGEVGGCNKCELAQKKAPEDGSKQQSGWRCCERVNNVTLASSDVFKPVIGWVDFVFHPTALLSQHRHLIAEDKLHYTGPPDTVSFAELVLQRSLPAHAPPFSV